MTDQPLVSVKNVSVVFQVRPQQGGKKTPLRAVNDVSFDVARGETLALVGESGSGKSTVARAVLRLVPTTAGSVIFDGTDLTQLHGRELRNIRARMQMVFQDPYSSLDPSSVVANIVGEPLRVHQKLPSKERNLRVRELLKQVGLSEHHISRYTYEFSGGQRQRIAIARAIALNPSLIVLDEAVSALDVSTQNQVLELLDSLRRQRGLSYLFISHNLGVVRWIADQTAVMYLGNLVETGPTARVHHHPAHPYTRSLISAMPLMDPVVQRHRPKIVLQGDPPDPLDEISGCAFRTRCPEAMSICAAVRPEPIPVSGGGWAACHLLAVDRTPALADVADSSAPSVATARQTR